MACIVLDNVRKVMPTASKNRLSVAMIGITLFLLVAFPSASAMQSHAHPCCPPPVQQYNSSGHCSMCRVPARVAGSLPSVRYQQQLPTADVTPVDFQSRPKPLSVCSQRLLVVPESPVISHHQLLI